LENISSLEGNVKEFLLNYHRKYSKISLVLHPKVPSPIVLSSIVKLDYKKESPKIMKLEPTCQIKQTSFIFIDQIRGLRTINNDKTLPAAKM